LRGAALGMGLCRGPLYAVKGRGVCLCGPPRRGGPRVIVKACIKWRCAFPIVSYLLALYMYMYVCVYM